MSSPIPIPGHGGIARPVKSLDRLKDKIEVLRFGVHARWVTSQSYFTPCYGDYAVTWTMFRNPFGYDWTLFDEKNRFHQLYLEAVLEHLRTHNPFDLPSLEKTEIAMKMREFVGQLEVLWNYCHTHK